MSNDAVFYRRRAEVERANAAEATLDNVRDRCERAAKSWEVMAGRAERTNEARRQRETDSTVGVEAPDAG